MTLAFVALALPASASAERIYRYVDDEGVVVLTNVAPGRTRRGVRMSERDGVLRLSADAPRPTGEPKRSSQEYEATLQEACDAYKIPIALARAVMAAESNFNPKAVSRAGAQGLMQLMPQTAAAMFVSDSFEPRQNIHGGVRYLRVLANQFDGDMVRIIAAYNAGPEAVKRAGGIPNIAETQEYVKRVLRLYYSYKGATVADRDEAGRASGTGANGSG